MEPQKIEALSFHIINTEAGDHPFTPWEWTIVRRMIHTSADFEYMTSVRFQKNAIDAGINAIRQGRTIVTDTNMARVGINKGRLEPFGASVKCLMTDPAIAQTAARQGTTRARAAVDAVVEDMAGGIYVVGNAPTALLRLIELIRAEKAAPALVVGVPVGFVNAAESKAALLETNYPCITNTGRKGGSNIGASVINALAILANRVTP
jgi:precorrin-8X/cobalt-precorrin-8 methylmutase